MIKCLALTGFRETAPQTRAEYFDEEAALKAAPWPVAYHWIFSPRWFLIIVNG